MIQLQVRQDHVRAIEKRLRSTPRLLATNVRSALKDAGHQWQGDMLDRFRGDPFRSRSGDFKRSFRTNVSGSSLQTIQLRNWTTHVAARVHEFGFIMRPVRRKWLTIPLKDNLTAAGTPRFPSAHGLFLTDGPKKNVSLAFVWAKGNLFLTRKVKGQRTQWLWVLKKRVRIPARLGFFMTWDNLKGYRQKRLLRALALTIQHRRSV